MVVIKDNKNNIINDIGRNYYDKLYDYSKIIGYSIEDDDELKIEFNPDRPDLYSFFALRENMKIFYDNNYRIKGILNNSDIKIIPDKSVLNERPYLLSFIAEGKSIDNKFNHIIDYQERLHDVIGKNRKKVAIGIHDLDNIKPPFKYTMVKSKNLKFTTYDNYTGTAYDILNNHLKGMEYKNIIKSKNYVPVIFDSNNDVMSMPPVVNGIKSKVSNKTSRFFFDITGIDFNAVRSAFYLFAYEMSYLGYKISAPLNYINDIKNYDFREIYINEKEIKNLMGFVPDDIVTLLRKMGYRCEISDYGYKINVPGNRIDVMGPVDIIEDIAKAYGYDNINEKKLNIYNAGKSNKKNDDINIIKNILISINYQEIKTFVLSSNEFYNKLNYSGEVSIENPKSMDYSVIRDRLYPGMLNFIKINKRNGLPVKIFEIGDVLIHGKQETDLCIIYNNSKAVYSDIYQVLNYLNARSIDKKIIVKENKNYEIIEGRGGDIEIDDDIIGIIGEMDPCILSNFEIMAPLSFLEINIDKFLSYLKN